MDYEMLKHSKLYETDLKQYIAKSFDYALKLKAIKI